MAKFNTLSVKLQPKPWFRFCLHYSVLRWTVCASFLLLGLPFQWCVDTVVKPGN